LAGVWWNSSAFATLHRYAVRTTEEDIRARWNKCPHTEAFRPWQAGPEEFAALFVRDWGIDMAPERLCRSSLMVAALLMPGAAQLLAALRPRFRLAALSQFQ